MVDDVDVVHCARCRIPIDLDDDGYYDKETWDLLCWECWNDLYGKPKNDQKVRDYEDGGAEWETPYA